jgi:hypothetical protein
MQSAVKREAYAAAPELSRSVVSARRWVRRVEPAEAVAEGAALRGGETRAGMDELVLRTRHVAADRLEHLAESGLWPVPATASARRGRP